jgi:hypothetical protein
MRSARKDSVGAGVRTFIAPEESTGNPHHRLRHGLRSEADEEVEVKRCSIGGSSEWGRTSDAAQGGVLVRLVQMGRELVRVIAGQLAEHHVDPKRQVVQHLQRHLVRRRHERCRGVQDRTSALIAARQCAVAITCSNDSFTPPTSASQAAMPSVLVEK